jgi:hypothetical protein
MSRPFTDITTSTNNNIKNGSVVTSCTFHGNYNVLNTYTQNYPIIADIQSKYGNRFYNGIFVILSNGMVDGGPS